MSTNSINVTNKDSKDSKIIKNTLFVKWSAQYVVKEHAN